MAVKFTTNLPAMSEKYLNILQDKIIDAVARAMARVVDRAVANAKGRTDRIKSGKMINAIQGEVEKEARRVIAEFGFTKEVEDYYIYQTVTGFTHWISGEFIEPTFAIRDAGEASRADSYDAIRRAIGSVRM